MAAISEPFGPSVFLPVKGSHESPLSCWDSTQLTGSIKEVTEPSKAFSLFCLVQTGSQVAQAGSSSLGCCG